VLADGGGKLLFVAGQIAWDQNQKIVSDDFVEQFDKALANVITVVKAAGGESTNIVRVVVYVTNKQEYLAQTKAVGERYRKHMGKHFPAMVLVQVVSLLDDAAKVETTNLLSLRTGRIRHRDDHLEPARTSQRTHV
jgi:enamine deaminase RidA (YjgF/YER057c/UK114 family)